MYCLDERLVQQLYRERLQEAEHQRLVRAVLRAQRRAANAERPASRMPRFGRLFGRRPAAAQA